MKHYYRLVKDGQPGVLAMQGGLIYREMIVALEQSGYQVEEIDAADAQRIKRQLRRGEQDARILRSRKNSSDACLQ